MRKEIAAFSLLAVLRRRAEELRDETTYSGYPRRAAELLDALADVYERIAVDLSHDELLRLSSLRPLVSFQDLFDLSEAAGNASLERWTRSLPGYDGTKGRNQSLLTTKQFGYVSMTTRSAELSEQVWDFLMAELRSASEFRLLEKEALPKAERLPTRKI